LTLIAVVDNDVHVLALMTDLFEVRGWTVTTCWDGDQAFAFLQEQQPDLVLLDLWLETQTNGWQVLRDLKTEPRTRAIPVVLLSERGDLVHTNEAWLQQLGVAVVPKPLDLDLLYHSVERLLTDRPVPAQLYPHYH
jgi:CheY-like chemotaxis protein